MRLGCAAGFIGAILAELLITPTGIGDLITYNQSIAEYPKMYAAIFSIIVFSVLFIELLERVEVTLFRPEKRARVMNAAATAASAQPQPRPDAVVEVRGISKIYPGGVQALDDITSIFRAAS